MRPYLKYFLFLIILNSNNLSYCQKKIEVLVSLPSDIDYKHLYVSFDNGLNQKPVSPIINDHKFTLRDSCFTRYGTLTFAYPDSTETDGIPTVGFWVTDKPAKIIFYRDNTRSKNPFRNFQLQNSFALEDMGGREFFKFNDAESTEARKFYKINRDSIRKNKALANILYEKLLKVDLKELEFIRLHANQYYSLWQFEREIAGAGNIKADSLLNFFHKVFPDSLKHTPEGKEMEKKLKGRINTKKGGEAPDFKVKDIKGNIYSLNHLRGKYVLLDFWASWCAPCMREIPNIKAISNKYPKDKLEIISVSLDRNKENFLSALEKARINWTQVFNDWKIVNSYAIGVVPQVFLIDNKGIVVYSRSEEDDLAGLSHLNEILNKELGGK